MATKLRLIQNKSCSCFLLSAIGIICVLIAIDIYDKSTINDKIRLTKSKLSTCGLPDNSAIELAARFCDEISNKCSNARKITQSNNQDDVIYKQYPYKKLVFDNPTVEININCYNSEIAYYKAYHNESINNKSTLLDSNQIRKQMDELRKNTSVLNSDLVMTDMNMEKGIWILSFRRLFGDIPYEDDAAYIHIRADSGEIIEYRKKYNGTRVNADIKFTKNQIIKQAWMDLEKGVPLRLRNLLNTLYYYKEPNLVILNMPDYLTDNLIESKLAWKVQIYFTGAIGGTTYIDIKNPQNRTQQENHVMEKRNLAYLKYDPCILETNLYYDVENGDLLKADKLPKTLLETVFRWAGCF